MTKGDHIALKIFGDTASCIYVALIPHVGAQTTHGTNTGKAWRP